MTKTLAIILNHNLPELTDNLYESLVNFQGDDYDLVVMDNGSDGNMRSKYTSIQLEKNIFWGGALNIAFQHILDRPQYDSLLFLNNDLEVNGEIFVRALRHELFKNDFAIVSPCIAGKPNPWKQMLNWGCKRTRIVKWIDNQAPLIHRKLIEAIGQFDESLYYGWGQELVCYDVCEDRGWKIGVCDRITMLHFAKQTILQDKLIMPDRKDVETEKSAKKPIDIKSFNKLATASYHSYFEHDKAKFEALVQYGRTYNENDIDTLPRIGSIKSLFRK